MLIINYLFKGSGVTFTSLELKSLQDLIPELLATCKKFDMKPNTYYEGSEYRVIYNDEEEIFMNLDTMIKFKSDISKDDIKAVSKFL